MNEASWNDCIDSNDSIRITPDKAKAKSLIETADGRVKYQQEITVKKENANYIFESYYTTVLELLHALIIIAGYKVKNHLCLGFYLKDVLKRDDLFRKFDDLRYKRNSLTYYGKRMDFETAKKAIAQSTKLSQEIKSLINKNI
ncbi:MAG: hypothetical protein ABIC91_05520 [Nanoarchaeota archaeon]|nr:hypothetical protein [Nanoarchaeota archaeon]MBU1030475.1 hypothetical protein [Nanoarchaeota archaeon]MBU1849743.1 hypothetical protein [Nanoarchaeota archaeon]